jgi:hypothetical protein
MSAAALGSADSGLAGFPVGGLCNPSSIGPGRPGSFFVVGERGVAGGIDTAASG